MTYSALTDWHLQTLHLVCNTQEDPMVVTVTCRSMIATVASIVAATTVSQKQPSHRRPPHIVLLLHQYGRYNHPPK
jgi:hypothetical protein